MNLWTSCSITVHFSRRLQNSFVYRYMTSVARQNIVWRHNLRHNARTALRRRSSCCSRASWKPLYVGWACTPTISRPTTIPARSDRRPLPVADLPIFVVLRNAYPGLREGKGFIYRLYRDSSPKRSGMDHTVLPANYTIPASIS